MRRRLSGGARPARSDFITCVGDGRGGRGVRVTVAGLDVDDLAVLEAHLVLDHREVEAAAELKRQAARDKERRREPLSRLAASQYAT